MAYQKQEWIDRVIDPAQIDPETGKPKVVQEGTRFTSTRANHFEKGIADAHNLVESLAKEWGGNFVAAPKGTAGLQFSTSGLTASWTAGIGYVNGRRFDVVAGNIALNATQGQYIYLDTDGVMKKTTSQATAEAGLLLWYFATDASQAITSTDKRNILNLDAMTIDQNLAPVNTGRIRNLLSGLANMVKKITGKANWFDAPRTTLENAVKLNGDIMTGGLTVPNLSLTHPRMVTPSVDGSGNFFFQYNGESDNIFGWSRVGPANYNPVVLSGGFMKNMPIVLSGAWKIQSGYVGASGATSGTITFPSSFSSNPAPIFLQAYNQNVQVWATATNATSISWASSAALTNGIEWLAIGS